METPGVDAESAVGFVRHRVEAPGVDADCVVGIVRHLLDKDSGGQFVVRSDVECDRENAVPSVGGDVPAVDVETDFGTGTG